MAGFDVSEARRPRALEEENARLKVELVARIALLRVCQIAGPWLFARLGIVGLGAIVNLGNIASRLIKAFAGWA